MVGKNCRKLEESVVGLDKISVTFRDLLLLLLGRNKRAEVKSLDEGIQVFHASHKK